MFKGYNICKTNVLVYYPGLNIYTILSGNTYIEVCLMPEASF